MKNAIKAFLLVILCWQIGVFQARAGLQKQTMIRRFLNQHLLPGDSNGDNVINAWDLVATVKQILGGSPA